MKNIYRKTIVYLNIFLLLTFSLFSMNELSAQSGTFHFSPPNTSDGNIVTQVISGVTLTVSDASNDVNISDIGGDAGTSGNTAYSRTETTSMTLSFSASVNITTIRCFDWDARGVANWTFTPNTGSPNTTAVDGNGGTTVTLNFTGITSIVITHATGSYKYGIDNVIMDGSLPVELTNFTAMKIENAVKLLWETATEVNNYGFQVERASFREDGTTPVRTEWEAISFIEGHGNSNSPKTYTFIDADISVAERSRSYRLKQIDTDGSFEYSEEVKVSISTLEKFALNQNYPNPFNPTTAIKFALPASGMVNLTVYNLLGQEVAVLINQQMKAGSYEKEFNADKLPSGTYIYRITVGDKFKSERKMIVLK